MFKNITKPLVEISDEPIYYNQKWGIKEIIKLRGKIINNEGYNAILILQEELRQLYQYNTLTLNLDNFERSNVILNNISFGQSDYLSNTEYTVSFTSYPNDFFDSQGILDPVNQWTFEETTNSEILVRHQISAKGINTSTYGNNAFDNAINYVQALAVIPINLTQFLTFPHNNFVLSEQRELQDRINGTYSLNETYRLDLFKNQKAVIKYTANITNPLAGFNQIAINGSVQGGINITDNELDVAFNSLNLQSIASEYYTDALGISDLNLTPLTQNTEKYAYKRLINFGISYDNNPGQAEDSDVSLDLNVTNNKDDRDITQVSVNGRVFGRFSLKDKWEKVQNYYQTYIDLYRTDAIENFAEQYYDGDYTINPKILSSSVNYNKFIGEINFNANLDDKPEPPAGLKTFEYNIGVELPFIQASSFALVGKNDIQPVEDQYCIQNLNYYNREILSIRGNAVVLDDITIEEGIAIIKTQLDIISSEYIKSNVFPKVKNITTNPQFGKNISFEYVWDYDSNPINTQDSLEICALFV